MDRKQDDADERFLNAFDRREEREITRSLGPIFRRHGHGMAPDTSRSVQRAEQQRVAGLISRDQADRNIEMIRHEAEQRVLSGDLKSSQDTVIAPTPEWERMGESRPYYAKTVDGSVRAIRTVRRVQTSIVARLHNQGKLSDDQLVACIWYADCHERAGISGRYKASNFSGMPGSPSGVSLSQHPAARHLGELEARRALRSVQSGMETRVLRIFEYVVIHNLPLRRAARAAVTDNSAIYRKFIEGCDCIIARCEATGVDLDEFGKRRS